MIAADLRVVPVGLLAKQIMVRTHSAQDEPKDLVSAAQQLCIVNESQQAFLYILGSQTAVEELNWRLARPGVLSNRYCVEQMSRALLRIPEHAGVNACMKYSIV